MDFDSAGKILTFTGKISDIPWQHMIHSIPEFEHVTYFDTDDGDQIVIYSKDKIRCKNTLQVTGEIFVLHGTSKRPGSNEKVSEIQLLVHDWKCLGT